MPNQDGTGPRGFGPLTGRGIGPCSGNRPIIDRPLRRTRRRSDQELGQGLANRRGFRGGYGNVASFSNSNLWTSGPPE